MPPEAGRLITKFTTTLRYRRVVYLDTCLGKSDSVKVQVKSLCAERSAEIFLGDLQRSAFRLSYERSTFREICSDLLFKKSAEIFF